MYIVLFIYNQKNIYKEILKRLKGVKKLQRMKKSFTYNKNIYNLNIHIKHAIITFKN